MTAFAKLITKRVGKNQKGLFADEDIKKDEKILTFPGKIAPKEKVDEVDLQIGLNKFIKPPKNSIDRFINHSCEPNSYVKKIKESFFLISLKDIKKGEEIMFDYDTTDYDNERFRFFCSCKSRNCRKTIRGFKYLNQKQKKKLEKYLIPYLKEIFEKEKNQAKKIKSRLFL